MRNTVIGISLLLLMWAGHSEAANPVSPRLDSLQVQVLSRVGVVTTGDRRTTLADVTRALNTAYAETCRKYPAIERFDTLVVTDTGQPPALPSDFAKLHAVVRLASSGVESRLRIPLTIIDDVAALPKLYQGLAANTHNKLANGLNDVMSPSACYTFGGRLCEHPKYSKSKVRDTLEVMYYAYGARLTSASDSCQVAADYLDRVVNYACMLIAEARGDYDIATRCYQMFETGMMPAKIREDEGKQ